MSSEEFTPALSQVFGSPARAKLIVVLAERRGEWLTASKLCDLADVSQSGFHRDHKSVLLNFGLMERRETDSDSGAPPKYTIANTIQAEYISRAHEALQSQLNDTGPLLKEDIEAFIK